MYIIPNCKYKRINLKTAEKCYNTTGVYVCKELINPMDNEDKVKFIVDNGISFKERLKKLCKTYGNLWCYVLNE